MIQTINKPTQINSQAVFMPSRLPGTTPEIIAAAQPYREACQPDKCTRGPRCWVLRGRAGYLGPSSKRSSCVECEGAIKEHLRPSKFELQGAR